MNTDITQHPSAHQPESTTAARHNIIDAMRGRRSVRSFDGHPLSPHAADLLTELAEGAWSPFGGKVTVMLRSFDLHGPRRPGTYGMIRGAVSYFLIGFDDDPQSALSAGFRFEQVVLCAWQLGLGTCWIAGTFRENDFDRGITWPDGQTLQAICPVGAPARSSLAERIARRALGSKNRKPFGSLFYDAATGGSLRPDTPFSLSLEMMRLAPSSTNSQPWRAIVDGPTVHFFNRSQSRMSAIDCGIGLCHFYEAERAEGHEGRFFTSGDLPDSGRQWHYVASWTRTISGPTTPTAG